MLGRARKKTRIAELEDEVADLKRRLARSEEQAKQFKSNEVVLREVIDSARSSLRIGVGSPPVERQRQLVMPSPPSSTSTFERGSVDEEFGAVGLEPSSSTGDFGFHGVEGEVLTTGEFGDEEQLGTETAADDIEGLVMGSGNTALTFGVPLSPNFDTMSYFWDHIFCKYFKNISSSNTNLIDEKQSHRYIPHDTFLPPSLRPLPVLLPPHPLALPQRNPQSPKQSTDAAMGARPLTHRPLLSSRHRDPRTLPLEPTALGEDPRIHGPRVSEHRESIESGVWKRI